MTIRSSSTCSYTVIGIALAVMLLLATFAFPAQGSAMPGDFYKGQLKAAKNKCKAKKQKRARSKCLKRSKGKATSATKRAMRGDSGFYGFRLKAKQIPGSNGRLVWAKPETGKRNVPGAGRTFNVLYSSKSFPGNRKIVVSGTVMVPKGSAPKGGWPVISWAHGTTGIADKCAPSRLLGQANPYGEETTALVKGWLEDGYAVVATDYEGLGTPGVHPYLVGQSEGRGVLDIVKAARQLNGKLSRRVVLAGHSQGGQAILFAANLATTKWGQGTDYRGTVSYAPVSNLGPQARNIGALDGTEGQYDLGALALMIFRGATIAKPSIKPRDLLTDGSIKLYPKVDTECLGQLRAAVASAELQPSQLLKAGWPSTPRGASFENELGKMNPNVRVGAPVLIPQGTADSTVQPTFTDLLDGQLKTTNKSVEIIYDLVTGADHTTILAESRETVSEFIEKRFNP